ncbi:MAG: aminotransferase DegT [Acidithiobacillales bacterium SM23_46]|jgi:dTDP-4-amino-4,6-dideoxygalactose transaminase|nr:MAG: aminotransferase DegT [Acidithiobacillales bacterium SM23_46]KPL28706.1 MAG: aminotransferase DegT [Acidithiobacillales bacterium SM1_46]
MSMLPFTRPTLGEEELQSVREVLESGWITTGPKAKALEEAIAAYVGGGVQARVFNSATSALEACLFAAGVGPGDEVIVPAMSFVATANVVVRVGARPVFVDVDLNSRNIRADRVGKAINSRTRAIMPVHFAGLAADLDPLYALAGQHGLLVIEDAAQAIGTEHAGHKVGANGNPVCFSFHPNKNMTTIEGGAVTATDPAFLQRLERIRFHGIERDADGNMDVKAWGGKMNLPDVNSAIGLIQLSKLDGFNARRRELASRYLQRLANVPHLVLPADGPGHSWHMFCVCVDLNATGLTRPQIQARLEKQGVGTGTHYPAMTLFSLYRDLGNAPGDFPVAERIGRETLTLPLFPTMTEADVDHVCDALQQSISSEAA